MRRRGLATALGLGLLRPLWAAGSTPRLALVLGNTEYQWRKPLDNAAPDAAQVARQLGLLDFEVTLRQNLTKARQDEALVDFGRRLQAAGPQAVCFFYYSGHAAQDLGQTNYLMPIDAKAESPAEFRQQATTLQSLFADIARTNNAVNLVVLDACRDWFHQDTSIEVPRGLHDMGRQGNMFIAMATSPGAVADDGGAEGSPFSRRLVEGLALNPRLSVSEFFDDLQGKVYADTGGGQAPEFINGMARAPRWSLAQTTAAAGATVALTPGRADGPLPRELLDLDRARLLAFANGRTSFVEALLDRRDLLARAGLTSKARLSYFLALVGFETGGFRFKAEEYFNYSAASLARLFPRKFPDERTAQAYVGHPERIANTIYANRIGNGAEDSGDGWRYRGRGYFAITGRDNYRRYGERVGVDLVANPDLVQDPETNLAVALSVWSALGLPEISDQDDALPKVLRRFSGAGAAGAGLEARAAWLKSARQALGLG